MMISILIFVLILIIIALGIFWNEDRPKAENTNKDTEADKKFRQIYGVYLNAEKLLREAVKNLITATLAEKIIDVYENANKAKCKFSDEVARWIIHYENACKTAEMFIANNKSEMFNTKDYYNRPLTVSEIIYDEIEKYYRGRV